MALLSLIHLVFLPGAVRQPAMMIVARALNRHEVTLHFGWSVQPIVALIAGVLILIRPQLLNFIVAAYLIITGLIGIFGLPW